jgi:hypothetical protein
MSAPVVTSRWPDITVYCAVVVAFVGMLFSAYRQIQIGHSELLYVPIAISFIASLFGIVMGIRLAYLRGKVMWMLPVALALTALMALLAIVASSLGTN